MEGSSSFEFLVLLSLGVVCFTGEVQIGPRANISDVVPYRNIHYVNASQDFNFGSFTKPYADFIDGIFIHLRESENITQQCQNDTKLLFQLAAEYNKLALKLLDATGKLSSGILEGGIAFPGYFSECLSVAPVVGDSDHPSFPLYGQYCSITIQILRSSRHEDIPDAIWDVLKKSRKPIFIGLCVPSSCSVEDISSSSNAVASGTFNGSSSSVGSCHIANEHKFSDNTGAIIFMSFLVFYLTFVVLASFFDAFCPLTEASEHDLISSRGIIQPDVQESLHTVPACGDEHSASSGTPSEYEMDVIRSSPAPSEPEEEMHEESQAPSARWILIKKCVYAFSLQKSASVIFSTRKASRNVITCLDGIRFLSMISIIAGHTYSFGLLNLFIRNPSAAYEIPKNGVICHAFSNGTLTVDSFYFLSGTLTAVLALKSIPRNSARIYAYFFLHRFIRLTPLLMIVVAFCALILRYVGEGPNWNSSTIMFDMWCRKNWWLNLLYVQNLFNTENMCLSHSWYIATDMQFSLLAALILLVSNWKFSCGAGLLLIFFIVSSAITFSFTWIEDYPAIPYLNTLVTPEKMSFYYKYIYIKPHCRLGPYLVGLTLGYIFFKCKKLTLSKRQVTLLWGVSIATALAVILGMWPAIEGKLPSTASAAFYSSLARSAWAVSLSWLAAACFYGYGGFVNNILSWPPLEPFSKLTYCAYLIHPIVMNVYYGTMETVVQFSNNFMLYLVIGNVVATFMLSFVLSVLFEMPFINLEKVITGNIHFKRS